jgi:hypothetical protein
MNQQAANEAAEEQNEPSAVLERLSWRLAWRDDKRVAQALYAGEELEEMHELSEAGLLDEFFAFLEAIGMMAVFEQLDLPGVHRELVPGGRLVLSFWGPLEQCSGYAALVGALEHHIGTAAASIMRAPFALGEASEVRSLLAGGPFHKVQLFTTVRTVHFASPEQFVRLEIIPSHLESPVARMDERALSVLISEVNRALQPYVSPSGLAFPMQAHLVTAQK